MTTPTTPEGKRKYDGLGPVRAALKAWRDAGTNPSRHLMAQMEVARRMPLLYRALNRLSGQRELLEELVNRHRIIERHDCGAQTEELPCRWDKRSSHSYHCTSDPGHEGHHADGLHCWSLERFSEALVVRYAPRDLSRCACGRGGDCRDAQLIESLIGSRM